MITESSLSLRDILPRNPKHYDKNRAPKFQGQATVVYFHVTVLSLDSINEESMVCTLIVMNVVKFLISLFNVLEEVRLL